MPSHHASNLTRHVFRRMLSEPRLHQHRLRTAVPRPRHAFPASTSRNIFGFSRGPQRQLRDADLDPGLGKMLELTSLSRAHARPPPAADLARAFNAFFRARQRSREPLQEVQAKHALLTFEHLLATNGESEGYGLTLEDLQVARDALVYMPKDNTDTHNRLARALFAEIGRRREADPSVSLAVGPKDLLPHVAVLCQTGDSLEARALVDHYWRTKPGKAGRRMWAEVLKGFARESNESELLLTTSVMDERGVPFDAKLHQVMTVHYAHRDNVPLTKRWYEHPIADGERPTYHADAQILKFCVRTGQLEWGSRVFHSMLEGTPTKKTWDMIFQWAAALGKGVDEIERMMEVMARRHEDDQGMRPDTDTINALVGFASSRNDPYAAERYVALGLKRGLRPDARTCILQMEYRLDAGDVDGARAAYDALQAEEVDSDQDLPAVNRLLRALAGSRHPPHDAIAATVADLAERKARLEPATVGALCALHLRREEVWEVHDLLQSHAFHYSAAQRADILNVLVAFCLDRANGTAPAWDAYSILRQVFDETPVSTRTRLMDDFFARGRPDMACHVFGHMRQATRPEGRPTADTYVSCLLGVAAAADLEGLEMVHNMLKLDAAIEPSTALLNALMRAYTAADMPHRSLDFWADISRSREGPDEASLAIALQACAAAPFGERRAREIWGKLRRTGQRPSRAVGAAYVGALAGQGLHAEAIDTIASLEEMGIVPDALILGTLYNGSPGQNRRDEVEAWARASHPDAWAELERGGRRSLADGTRRFALDGGSGTGAAAREGAEGE
ncbi:MAG: hypothetical protein M1832_003794 [Thelocarpon impressellum]|nr:MAG: hypothetical protein M1832_003794 [Thelocarpon impressellum]